MKILINNQDPKLIFELEVETSTTVEVVKLKISSLKGISYNIIEL